MKEVARALESYGFYEREYRRLADSPHEVEARRKADDARARVLALVEGLVEERDRLASILDNMDELIRYVRRSPTRLRILLDYLRRVDAPTMTDPMVPPESIGELPDTTPAARALQEDSTDDTQKEE